MNKIIKYFKQLFCNHTYEMMVIRDFQEGIWGDITINFNCRKCGCMKQETITKTNNL